VYRRSGLVVAVVVIGIAGLLSAPGCSDSSDRASGRKLLESVWKSQRLSARAAAMLANVVLKVDDDYAPVFAKVRGPVKVVAPVGIQVNPKAIAALEEAESLLRTAIREADQAPKETLALAGQTLAHVLRLKGSCGASQAANARGRLLSAVVGAQQNARVIREHLSLLAFAKQLAQADDSDLEQMLAEADTAVTKLDEKVQGETTVVADERDRSRKLEEQMLALNAKARELRAQSDRAGGEQSLALFDKAQELEREGTGYLSQIEKLELATASREAMIAELRADADGARRRQAIAKEMLVARRQGADARDQISQRAAEALEASIRKMEEQDLPEMVDLCKQLTASEQEGLASYAAAAQALKTVRDVPADQAAIAAAAGDLEGQSLLIQEELQRLSQEIKVLWGAQQREIPEGVSVLTNYMPEPDKVRASVATRFEETAKLYQQAGRSADRQEQWIYQAHEANAYYRVARLRRDADALQKAREAIERALEGRREAPLMRDAVRLEAMISAAG
jgi:hypothetical protein